MKQSVTALESAERSYLAMPASERRFAQAAYLAVHEFGNETTTKAKVTDFLCDKTDGELSFDALSLGSPDGFIEKISESGAARLRLSPGLLLTPGNIMRQGVTSALIAASLEQTGDDRYTGIVAQLLRAFGVRGSDPIKNKDKYVFGYVMPPKASKSRDPLGVCALDDVGDLIEVGVAHDRDSVTGYLKSELGGNVAAHDSLANLIRRILGNPESDVLPNNMTYALTRKYNYLTTMRPPIVGNVSTRGIFLGDFDLSSIVTLQGLEIDFEELDRLKKTSRSTSVNTARLPESKVEASKSNGQKLDNPKKQLHTHTHNRNLSSPENIKGLQDSIILALKDLKQSGKVTVDELKEYASQVAVAVRVLDFELLEELIIELKNKDSQRT